MNGISLQIETLRQQLHETVSRYRGNLLHPHVLRMSQELDMLIVKVQQKQKETIQRKTKETGTES